MKKIALVTGASSGIGAASVISLLEAGFEVHGAARRFEQIPAGAIAHHLDVTDPESILELSHRFPKLDLLVANAGGAFDATTVMDADLDSWSKTFEINVLGTIRTIKAFKASLLNSSSAHIILMGSTAGRVTYEMGGSYIAAKHAIAAIAGTLRLELNEIPIRVSEIAPGMVKTDEFALNRFAGDSAKAAKVYEGVAKPLTADDIGKIVAWTASQPDHVNLDLVVVRPVAQAAQHKVHRITK